MDHHCPWIDNCVGFGNHKFFLLLIGYSFLCCLIALATSCPELIYCAAFLAKLIMGAGSAEHSLVLCDIILFLVFGVLALLFATLLAPMVLTHFELASYNVTTIEGHYEGRNMPNPFDHGDTTSNLSELFGAYSLDWFLPVSPLHPLSDGICFMRSKDGLCTDALSEAGCDVDWDTAEEQLWRLRYQVQNIGSDLVTRRRPSATPASSWWWGGSDRARAKSFSAEAAGGQARKAKLLRDSLGRRIVSI
mmetsp:Transcript_96281/g.277928  ORF Transcript_96281/g.277928 Transcript_96281/m.277928 type:complete len:248 (+) Transcript_96281:1-744(+)